MKSHFDFVGSPGTPAAPLRTIQRAADLAQPGDTVTVHAGVYRERVNPPRGGESDAKRIVYQAAAGEQVVITGSEEVLKPLTATPLWFASVDTTNTVIWLDTGALFLESNGNLNRDLIKDGLHPSTKGYYAWAEAMEPTIKKLMGE